MIYHKYTLYTSVSGSDLYDYIKSETDNMINYIKRLHGFDNFINYKNLYYAKLYSLMRDF
jgi:hypothetical protein